MGPGTQPSKHPPPDQNEFQRMLMVLRLQVNSWAKKSRPFTFKNGETRAQISFIIMQSAQADQVARNAKILFDYPGLKWRFGPMHHSVTSSVPMLHYQTATSKGSLVLTCIQSACRLQCSTLRFAPSLPIPMLVTAASAWKARVHAPLYRELAQHYGGVFKSGRDKGRWDHLGGWHIRLRCRKQRLAG